eukprot:6173301-Pleurochrysis_carterae.AAC.1
MCIRDSLRSVDPRPMSARELKRRKRGAQETPTCETQRQSQCKLTMPVTPSVTTLVTIPTPMS